jgi:hypothetical protein
MEDKVAMMAEEWSQVDSTLYLRSQLNLTKLLLPRRLGLSVLISIQIDETTMSLGG